MLANCCNCKDRRHKDANSDHPEVKFANAQSAKSNRRHSEDFHHLGGVLSLLWPTISAYAVRLIAVNLRPAIAEILPQDARQQFKFDLSSSYVGEQPAVFRQRYEKKQVNKSDEIISRGALVAAFEMVGDMVVLLKVSNSKLGINGIGVRGVLNVEVVQSSPDQGSLQGGPSSVEGLRVFLVEDPEVVLHWHSNASQTDRSAVTAKLSELVSAVVVGVLQVPNVLAFPLAPDVDVFDIKAQLMQGLLHVHAKASGYEDSGPISSPLDPGFVLNKAKGSGLGLFGLSCYSSTQNSEPRDGGKSAKDTEVSSSVELRCGADAGSVLMIEAVPNNLTFLLCDLTRQRLSVKLRQAQQPLSSSLGEIYMSAADMSTWGNTAKTLEVGDASKHLRLTASWRPILDPAPLGFLKHDDEQEASISTMWFLSIGVYGVLGLPRFGEGTLHWIVAECDQVALQDGIVASKASHALAESSITDSKSQPLSSDDCAGALRRKLGLLQKQGLNATTIAQVFEVDDELLAEKEASAALAERNFSAQHPGLSTQDFRWESLFSFATMSPQNAELNLKLLRRSPGKSDLVTDRYSCKLRDLFRSDNHQVVQAASLKNTGALLELRMELRPLAKPEGCLVAI